MLGVGLSWHPSWRPWAPPTLQFSTPTHPPAIPIPPASHRRPRRHHFQAGRRGRHIPAGPQLCLPHLTDWCSPHLLCAGDPTDTIPKLAADAGASLVVTDFTPLRLGRQWREGVAAKLEVPFHEVDAHNVVPCWVASGEQLSWFRGWEWGGALLSGAW